MKNTPLFRHYIRSCLTLTIVLGLSPTSVLADQNAADNNSLRDLIRDEVAKQMNGQKTSPWDLSVKGYGDIRFAYYDYPEDEDASEGSRGDSRADFDTTRFAIELEGEHEPSGVEFEIEAEFEHGGSGSSAELEQEDDGVELESEVEKGGEVVLEEFFLEKDWGDGWTARAGRFYVAVGLLSDYHLPTDYLGSGRPETETHLIPGVWDEIGLQLRKDLDWGHVTAQVVNGLDSTGFSSSSWISGGHQSKFETARAEDLAYILRVDYTQTRGLVLGSSVYYGGTTDNRPAEDLASDGSVLLGDIHARYSESGFRMQTAALYGHVSDADEISVQNAAIHEQLDASESPVAENAVGLWAEAGYDVGPELGVAEGHKIEPFYRFDYYDTFLSAPSSFEDNSNFERYVHTFGVAYTYQQFITAKLDYTWRTFGEDDIDDKNMVRLGLGFVF